MSPKAAGLAVKAGYKNVKVYLDGTPAWVAAGKPLEVKPEWVWNMAKDNAIVLIDGRKTSAYKRGHAKGAYGFIKVANSSKGVKGLKDKKAPIVLYGEDAEDTYKVCRKFEKKQKRSKYKNVLVMAGGYDAYVAAGFPTATGKSDSKVKYVKKLAPGAVPVTTFLQAVETGGAVILDIRTATERQAGAFKGSVHIPLDKLMSSLDKLPKDRPIYAHCASGSRASTAYALLSKKGYNVKYLNETVKCKGGDCKCD
jgi:rhodanese-related sulfurtransferase